VKITGNQAVAHEIDVHFRFPLRHAVLADPDSPLLAAAALTGVRPLTPEQEAARRAAEEREAIERVLTSMTDAARQMQVQQDERLGEMRQAAVELAVAIASRLVHDKLEAGDLPVDRLVRQVVDKLGIREAVKVHLHPQDLALLKKKTGDVGFPGMGPELQLLADPAISRGGCRAETGDVSILSQLEVQLVEIRKILLGAIAHAEAERG
jgi:flagellar assembly protein FliH